MIVNLFSIGLMTLFLSFNTTLSYAEMVSDGNKMLPNQFQSKGKTIKKGDTYIGNMEQPRQVAAYGTPAWLFKTIMICFDGDIFGMTLTKSVYSINMYTGGVGEALRSESTESFHASYRVKDGRVYVWDLNEGEPKDESDYVLILSIEDGYLTLVKTKTESFKPGNLIYMGNHNEIKKMSETKQQQVEIEALNKLLRN